MAAVATSPYAGSPISELRRVKGRLCLILPQVVMTPGGGNRETGPKTAAAVQEHLDAVGRGEKVFVQYVEEDPPGCRELFRRRADHHYREAKALRGTVCPTCGVPR